VNRAGKVLILASLAAAMGFYLFDIGLVQIAWALGLKGAAVGLLAAMVLTQGKGLDHTLLALVMAMGALGDVAIETSVTIGALAFLIGHGLAIGLYVKNRRAGLGIGHKVLALASLPILGLIAFALPADRTVAPLVTLYALGLAAMASSAGISRFAGKGVALGAMLFVASDLLIFARMGPLSASQLPDLAIWPLYYCGQYLICLGVLQVLRADQTSV
jgi:uncharacterized membrane protein YhhN